MANTYTLIQAYTVTGSVAPTISFSSIPNTYTDLVLRLSLKSDTAGSSRALNITFNSDTGSNYLSRYTYGYSAGTATSTATASSSMYIGLIGGSSYASNVFSNIELYIPNYLGSNRKIVQSDSMVENNSTTAYYGWWGGVWTGTSAISSIQILGSTNFDLNSTAYLYGVKNS